MARQIKRITRSTRLTAEEAAKIAEIRVRLADELPDMKARAKQLLLQVREDRDAIANELDDLASQNERLTAAAAEDTLSGHLRQAIHASRRSPPQIACDAGIDTETLLGFLEGDHGLPSETLDRIARAAGVVVTLSPIK
jgi:AcrR family transcriptional regulator